jgi:hypothetical protein
MKPRRKGDYVAPQLQQAVPPLFGDHVANTLKTKQRKTIGVD